MSRGGVGDAVVEEHIAEKEGNFGQGRKMRIAELRYFNQDLKEPGLFFEKRIVVGLTVGQDSIASLCRGAGGLRAEGGRHRRVYDPRPRAGGALSRGAAGERDGSKLGEEGLHL